MCQGSGGGEYPVPWWILSNIPDFYPLEFIDPPLPKTVTTINISIFGQISLGNKIVTPCGLKLLPYWCFLHSHPKQTTCPSILVSGCASEEPKQDREVEERHTRGVETICEMVSVSETEKIMNLRWGCGSREGEMHMRCQEKYQLMELQPQSLKEWGVSKKKFSMTLEMSFSERKSRSKSWILFFLFFLNREQIL